jgi:membrane dipeptidase
MDVMEYSSKPVILSHSNPRALHEHPRNVTDDVMRACAATGGVVGLNGIGIFLGDNDISTDTFVRHVDYVVALLGPEHVGLGIDYAVDQKEIDEHIAKMRATFPPGLGYEAGVRMIPPEQLPEIVERLLQLGYTDENLRGLLGGNWLRVAKAVWRANSSPFE